MKRMVSDISIITVADVLFVAVLISRIQEGKATVGMQMLNNVTGPGCFDETHQGRKPGGTRHST